MEPEAKGSPDSGAGAVSPGRQAGEQGAPVRRPDTAEEWDNFITRYSLGEFYTSNFSSITSPSGAPGIEQLSSTFASSSLHDASNLGSSVSTKASPSRTITPSVSPSPPTNEQQSQPAPAGPLPRPSSGFKSSSGQDPSEIELSDSHPNVSTSGPANQDPDIPNIAGSQLPPPQPVSQHRRRMAKKALENDGQAVTSDNVRRLDRAQQRNGSAEREKKNSAGSGGRRRNTSRAALASVGHTASLSSSSEEGKPRVSSRQRRPTSGGSRGSVRSRLSKVGSVNLIHGSIDAALLESNTNSSTSVSQFEFDYDHAAERTRVREFFDAHGYMPAPLQSPGSIRRRLRVIRRLGLENPESYHRKTLDRFTRLAINIFKTKMAIVSIVGKDRQTFVSEIGLNKDWTDLDVAFCSHTIMGSGEQCMIVPDANRDWRFKKNPFVGEGSGPIQFYAGVPLVVGSGHNTAIIGSLCVIDDKPREFSKDNQSLLRDLAESAVRELELLYSQQSIIDSAKLHQISVDFLRRSLKNRPTERAGSGTDRSITTSSACSGSDSRKRKEGADTHVSEEDVDIYDEACREIRLALDAYAVAVVDLSQFHMFYPAYQSSSTAATSTRGGSASNSQSMQTGSSVKSRGPASTSDSAIADEADAYSKSTNVKRARKTWAITDPTAPSRTPQVLFIPGARKSDPKQSKYSKAPEGIAGQHDVGPDCFLLFCHLVDFSKQLAVLGYSCAYDGFAFNFTSSPAARKIISDFIASNVKTRRVWYTRDDSEGIAQSITHLMPPRTETSMAMPVFGFDGQVAFAIVACWTDPLYSYPSGAMQFVETIAGILLASVMKERLHQAERAQLSFAAAASHELRTPLHQINAAAALLRSSLHPYFSSPRNSPSLAPPAFQPSASPQYKYGDSLPSEDQCEALAQLEIIEANGVALGNTLENIIDSLDIGRLSSRMDQKTAELTGKGTIQPSPACPQRTKHFGRVVEQVILDAVSLESKSRRVAGGPPMQDVEVIVEITPRNRGQWLMTDDSGPLMRALGKLVHNACKFTEKGYIHVIVQDVSRDVVIPAGYDNSIKISTVSIDIKDSGCGMTPEFLEKEVLQPFTKADPFMPGAGLGLGLAQRMIEILAGKFAIASTLNKGTLVHIEIPLHLLNEDNESDQDELEVTSDAGGSEGSGLPPRSPIRQDGIYLAGFDCKDLGMRRVGKSLTRTLMLHFCRVVTEIQYASLIVAPDRVDMVHLADVASRARPGVHIIILRKDGGGRSSLLDTSDDPTSPVQIAARELLQAIPMRYLNRPLGPSLIREIVKPVEAEPQLKETFISPVAGGSDAQQIAESPKSARPSFGRGSSIDTLRPSPREPSFDAELIPSPPTSPDQPPVSAPFPDMPDAFIERSHFIAPLRPGLNEQATDPLPVMTDHSVGWLDSSGSGASGPLKAGRPLLKEAKSTPAVPETKPGGPLRVLVVEDNGVNRKILTTMLKRTGCQYAEAVDGQDAVNKFLSFSPGLVLLDINMPHKDGFTAAAEMRQIETSHKRVASTIIAVTALSGEAQKRRGLLECGITQWKTKPVSIKELKADVERTKVAAV